MKTAISVPDTILQEADKIAREIGVSRSGLISMALQELIRKRRNESMLEQLNRVYQEPTSPAEKKTLLRMKKKFHSTIRESW